jgi:membrane protease subunit (stomatin/prohibitin family)
LPKACPLRWKAPISGKVRSRPGHRQDSHCSIEYDANTRELLTKVQRADALAGARGNSNLQASVASGIESAGETGGAAGLMGLGMASGMLGGIGSLQQPVAPVAPAAEDPLAKLKKAKEALDLGLITQADYDAVKAKVLGL